MSQAFAAAWMLGAAATLAGAWWDPARLALLPAGAVVTAVGLALWRRADSPPGFIEGIVLRAARARLAGRLLVVLGIAWLATGAAQALA
jgi:hypothetical protein